MNTRITAHIGTALILGWLTYVTLSEGTLWFLDGVNLIFHEAGHFVFFFAPQFIVVLGGTLMQLAVPLVCVLAFWRQRAFLSTMVALWWLGQSLVNVSVYVADARAQALPLLGGDGVLHDWNFLLGELGMLKYDTALGQMFFVLGASLMLFTVVHTAARIYSLWRHRYHV